MILSFGISLKYQYNNQLRKQKWEENNYMDTSADKLRKWVRYVYAEET